MILKCIGRIRKYEIIMHVFIMLQNVLSVHAQSFFTVSAKMINYFWKK